MHISYVIMQCTDVNMQIFVIPKIFYLLLQQVLVKDKGRRGHRVSLMILYMFFVFLFPTTSGTVNTSLIPFVENIEEMDKYAWAFPVYDNLIASLVTVCKKMKDDPHASVNFSGCSTTLLVSKFNLFFSPFYFIHWCT